jgi:hypothetical protein
MAGAIADMLRSTLKSDFRRIDLRSARIILVEGAPRILPTFAESLSQKAYARVVRMGVEIRTNALVERVDAVRSGRRGRAHCKPYGALDGGREAVARWPVAVAKGGCTPGERPGPRAARVKSTCRHLSITRQAIVVPPPPNPCGQPRDLPVAHRSRRSGP